MHMRPVRREVRISTHAPRTGSDRHGRSRRICQGISTHAPRTGSDELPAKVMFSFVRFQPTLPARGATIRNWRKPADSLFQPTLPARGATRRNRLHRLMQRISTHAPRTGSDPRRKRLLPARKSHFNPRSPHGERLHLPLLASPAGDISTHAPRTGSDEVRAPRPCRPRRFQPTLPARGATRLFCRDVVHHAISTHAPRTGSDGGSAPQQHSKQRFQPTLPARGATIGFSFKRVSLSISTHAPRTGSDLPADTPRPRDCISTHAPRTGSDLAFVSHIFARGIISTHAPRTGSDCTRPRLDG